SITIPDFLGNRFNDPYLLRVISALVILLFFTFYTSSGMVAGSKLFEASFGLLYLTALWFVSLVFFVFTFLCGFLVVVLCVFLHFTHLPGWLQGQNCLKHHSVYLIKQRYGLLHSLLSHIHFSGDFSPLLGQILSKEALCF